MTDSILILDFGSQYTQLLARRLRELGVFAEIAPYSIPVSEIRARAPKGLILSGGPAGVRWKGAPRPDKNILSLGTPILGICYGMQWIIEACGGRVRASNQREYGASQMEIAAGTPLFEGLSPSLKVWMSHGDSAEFLGNGFKTAASTRDCRYAAIADEGKKLYGVQFHPEVVHTEGGADMLRNFSRTICRIKSRWTPAAFPDSAIAEIRRQAGNSKVVCAVSGGVDSAVAAVLIHKAVGPNLRSIFVDTGLLRLKDREKIERLKSALGLPIKIVSAEKLFLKALQGVADPEKKRKIIGKLFIDVFEKEARRIGPAEFLAQGTLYPDVIESVSVLGPSAAIKSHHNVGGLPKRMKLKLIEPLRLLFKDEVRALGSALEIPEDILGAHPFPGPGLAIRIMGEVTRDRLQILRLADAIFQEELKSSGEYARTWQAFAVFLPIKSVGIMGDARSYENVIALRAVTSQDAMTADWAQLPRELLRRVSARITRETRGVNRVVYDITSKPPGTIEWE